MKLEKITSNSHNGKFYWLLTDKSHTDDNTGNSNAIRELVESHNLMVDKIQQLENTLSKLLP